MSASREELDDLGRAVQAALPGLSDASRFRQRNAIVALADSPAPSRRLAWGAGLALAAAVVLAVIASVGPSEDTTRAPAVAHAPQRAPTPADSRAATGGAQHTEPSGVAVPPAPLPEPDVRPNPDAVVLTEGTLALGRGEARSVTAGPYSVTLDRESACELAWDPQTQTLDLKVTRGSVVLNAPTSHHTIVAGDQARADPGEIVVSTVSHFVAPPRNQTPTPKWRRLANEGRYKDAMTLVEDGNVLDRLRSLSRSELKALADVARLGGAPSKAEGILLNLRERFPKSREAERAAFYLGRQAEREGHSAAAVRWYRVYLETRPGGSLSPEVRGRLLSVLAKRGELAAARVVATEYLKRHPKGAYAGAAEKIVGP